MGGWGVNALAEDRDGVLWVGTNGGGLFRGTGGRWQNLRTDHGLSGNVVYALAEDREGTLWVGTDGGLDQLRDTPFISHTTREGLPHQVLPFCDCG